MNNLVTLREWLDEKGWTTRRLAEELRIPDGSTVRLWFMRGEKACPSVRNQMLLEDLVGLPLDKWPKGRHAASVLAKPTQPAKLALYKALLAHVWQTETIEQACEQLLPGITPSTLLHWIFDSTAVPRPLSKAQLEAATAISVTSWPEKKLGRPRDAQASLVGRTVGSLFVGELLERRSGEYTAKYKCTCACGRSRTYQHDYLVACLRKQQAPRCVGCRNLDRAGAL